MTSELIINTASRCILGDEIRDTVHAEFASLYMDLEKGISHLSFFAPWLPTAAHRKRDRARRKLSSLFTPIIQSRRRKQADHGSGQQPPLEDKPPAPPGCELQLGRVERRFDLTSGSGSLSSYAEFELDAIAGRLVVELDVIPSSRADIVAAVTSSRSLEMPRMPPTPIPAAMQLLHSQLSADFLGDEGVRLGLQTTYLDADMHITRCLTRELSGACCVHVRVSD